MKYFIILLLAAALYLAYLNRDAVIRMINDVGDRDSIVIEDPITEEPELVYTNLESETGTTVQEVPMEEIQDVLGDPCEDLLGLPQDHCYQETAWDNGEVRFCDKIQGESFRYSETSPPKNKCISMVALKLCDPAVCNMIENGDEFFSSVTCKQRISRICP
ncbi:hypothetical protein KJ652_01465 [Patescibacteria group bacterium]|nr:hypothetical protein [Patescibacteria group bacterium]MBU1123237.1 hypothetical protein [Patescibacteria group bacterium]MBU1910919.1 hypothetical protein [Patescibacteria group bacterium]